MCPTQSECGWYSCVSVPVLLPGFDLVWGGVRGLTCATTATTIVEEEEDDDC